MNHVKILVIDDSKLQRTLIKVALENSTSLSCLVHEAADGVEGLRRAVELKPDVILCDINMPQMDGYTFIEMFRQNAKISRVPIVMITSLSTRDALRKAMGTGADDYLTKPFTDEELIEAVAVQLQKTARQEDQTKNNLDTLRKSIMTAMPHELRTPLTSILTGSELLIAKGQSINPEKSLQILKNIHRGAKRLETTIARYLELIDLRINAKVNNESSFLFNEEWLTQVLGDPMMLQIINSVSPTIDANPNSTINKSLSRLEYEIEPFQLRCDSTDLIKVLHELVGNAFKFSGPESPIKIIGASSKQGYTLNISNQGTPMPEQFASLGGDFMQFGREETEQQGLGLGLSLAIALLRRNHAELTWWQVDGNPNLLQITWPLKDS